MRPAGQFNRRCTVHRRAVLDGARGSSRGEYLPVAGLTRIACAYRETGLKEAALGNGAQGLIDAQIILRDCRAARTITNADRVDIEGVGFAIVSAGLPDRGDIVLQVRKDQG
ncbi:MAG: hypothetical protein LCH38_10815 [Proteobacteria bacterium]|nr:hypothetical protein [Pseudomonadota bacterium]